MEFYTRSNQAVPSLGAVVLGDNTSGSSSSSSKGSPNGEPGKEEDDEEDEKEKEKDELNCLPELDSSSSSSPSPSLTTLGECISKSSLVVILCSSSRTAKKIVALLKAANVAAESYWPSLFAKLAEKRNIEDLITNVDGDSGAAVAAPAADAVAAPAAAAVEEKKVNVRRMET
ncbi:hypothetical protein RJ640_001228 [Escallonia rubra]|uniref:Uncharacterized protein n=1 Tax=Escallonia rubra TaxID=112253 RepID=A0AA88QRM4_9ASTE|nr:hypothetical protein RJ640_001228 [Escallonia rubra]